MLIINFIQIKDVTILQWLLSNGLRILLIIALTYLLGIILKRIIIRTVKLAVEKDKFSSKEGRLKRERTLIRIFSGVVNVIIWLMAVMMLLQELNIKIGPLLAGAGIVGVAVGFGGQYLIRDLIAGFFIIFENQYRIGDIVKFDNVSGMVEDITLRTTILRDIDGIVHHIPNGEIKIVSNMSKGFARVNINIGVSYNADIDKVINVINQTGQVLAEDEVWKQFIIKPIQFLRIDEFADSAVIIKVLGETVPHKQWEVGREFRKRIKAAFDKEGISIPFPQIVIHKAD